MRLMSIINPTKKNEVTKTKIIVTEQQLKMIVEKTSQEINKIIESYAVQNQKDKK